jgi:hypothetical protein
MHATRAVAPSSFLSKEKNEVYQTASYREPAAASADGILKLFMIQTTHPNPETNSGLSPMKTIFVTVSILIITPVMLFAGYDLLAFQPQRPRIEALIAGAAEDERSPPRELVTLVRTSMRGKVSMQATRVIVSDLPAPHVAHGMLGWHLTNLLWIPLVKLHISDHDQISLLLARADMGNGVTGYSAAARFYFHKGLSKLSTEETAKLVAIGKAPSRAAYIMEHESWK